MENKTPYLLTGHDIVMIVDLNFRMYFTGSVFNKVLAGYPNSPGSWNNPQEFIKRQKNYWSPLFEPALKRDKSLSALIDEFWEKAKHTQALANLAGNMFKGKIYLEDVFPLVFNASYYGPTKTERKEFLKRIINNNPWLMNELHKKVSVNPDNILTPLYIELLPKHVVQIKDAKENIWKCIDCTKKATEPNSIKILTSLVNSFEPTEDFYIFLKNQFAQQMERQHGLREKFIKYEKKYFSQFVKKEDLELFPTTQVKEYRYILGLKDRVLVDNLSVPKEHVVSFKACLEEAILSVMNQQIGQHIYSTRHMDEFWIRSNHLEDENKIYSLMNDIKNFLPQLVTSLSAKEIAEITHQKNKDCLINMIKPVILKKQLEETLEIKQSKKSLHKI